MPEWKSIVQSNLKDLDLIPSEREEIAAELASHLEDLYEQFLVQGWSECEAFRLALEETTDWQELDESIARVRRKEGVMNRRTKTLWLPGLVAFASASILLMILERLIMLQPRLLVALERAIPLRPTFWWKDQVVVIYLCWWILLPLCGAAGACMSRRAGGTRLACVAASLFPAIVVLCIFCFVLPIGIAVEKNTFVMQHPLYFVLAMVNWTMVPGLALILGALPFLRQPTKAQTQ
jgi:hypothetical protein